MKKTVLLISVFVLSACDESTTPLLRVTHPGGTISGGEVWAEAVHVLEGNITVEDGTLVVPACSVIEMPDNGVLKAGSGGSLEFVGTADCPIRVTSSQAVPAAGDWNQIEIDGGASNSNTFDWVIFEYGGGSSYGSIWMDDDTNLSMSNSTVRDSGHAGLRLYNGARFDTFVNNTLIDNATGAMQLYAGTAGDLGVGTYGPNTIEGIIIQGGTVSEDATWLAHDAPYVIDSDVSIDGGSGSARLTVDAGATIAVAENRGINVRTNAGLTLAGTAGNPVTITSAKPVPAAGDWGDIEIYSDSVGAYNDFDHAIIEYGGGSSYGSIWLDDDASLAMTNSTVRDSGDSGIRLYNDAELRDFTGNTIIDNAAGALMMFAGSVDDLGAGTYSPNTIDGIRIVGGTVDHDCTWLAHDAPYIIESDVGVSVASGGSAHLTVAAGTTIALSENRGINIRENGALTLAGVAGNRITITSAKPVPAAGDWNDIELYGSSVAANNVFTYVDIEYGGGSSYGQLWVDSGAGVTLDNVVFSNAGSGGTPAGCDVRAYSGGTVTATNSTYVACNP